MNGAAEARLRRQRVVERLRRATGADAAIFFDVVGAPDRRLLTNHQVSGDAEVRALFQRYEGAPAPQGSSLHTDETTVRERRSGWSLEAPLSTSHNRFDDSAHGFQRPLQSLDHLAIVQDWYQPIEIAQEFRALLYDDGGCFLGWLGVIRRGPRPFRPEQRAAAQALLGSLRRSLLDAAALDALGGTAHLVARADGTIECATELARPWLTGDRTVAVRALVRGSRRGGPRTAVVDGVELTVLPLLGATPTPRLLVTLVAGTRARLSPHGQLTQRQRQIAALCSQGATITQVAKALAVSPNTVKFHLKALYETLGVSSRAELGRAWASGAEPPEGGRAGDAQPCATSRVVGRATALTPGV